MQSDDMSMFRKMKDRIADEVSSATNRLQNIQQIREQLVYSDQRTLANNPIPTQLLPEPSDDSGTRKESQGILPRRLYAKQFNLINDKPAEGTVYAEEEELGSAEISPQHQLFDERTIERLTSTKTTNFNTHDRTQSSHPQQATPSIKTSHDEVHTVINLDELSSDLEDFVIDNEEDSKDDVEIDLLNDKDALAHCDSKERGGSSNHGASNLDVFKDRYRNVVRTLRKLNKNHSCEKANLEKQIHDLNSNLINLKTELDEVKQQQQSNQDSLLSASTSASDAERAHNSSPQPSGKAANKIKDQERLIAKCKESLKAKNAQLKVLRDALANVDKFEESFEGLRADLKDLKAAHSTWTVSIAESKRVMHQEIENKNAEIDSLKTEIKNLQNQLKESQTRCMNLKSNLQALESRMVSTSAAHQKERESLIKELNNNKNNAIKQIQNEHKLNIERIKIDLEKSIEALKSEILIKDEQIIKDTKFNQELNDKNLALTNSLEVTKEELSNHLSTISDLNLSVDSLTKENAELRDRIEKFKCDNCETLAKSNEELQSRIDELAESIKTVQLENDDLLVKVKEAKLESAERKECETCHELQERIRIEAEKYEQSLFEQAMQLDLMTTANSDLEKAFSNLKSEYEVADESLKSIRPEYDELVKKNESLTRIIQDNENELQSQSEQLDRLNSCQSQLDDLKREISALASTLEQTKGELSEKNVELLSSRSLVEDLTGKIESLEVTLRDSNKALDDVRKEKDSIHSSFAKETKARQEAEEQLVVNIIAAMKNLETPNTSPGSDKVFQPITQPSEEGHAGLSSAPPKGLPDPVKLASQLSTLALDRSSAYLTATQRLQAVLLDQTMMSEEISRLKEELMNINRERHIETQQSMDEFERLKSENQALIHDQKAYDDQISSLEAEISALTQQLEQRKTPIPETCEVSTETKSSSDNLTDDLHTSATPPTCCATNQTVKQADVPQDVPNSTEFEYLRNIGKFII